MPYGRSYGMYRYYSQLRIILISINVASSPDKERLKTP